MGHRLIDMHAHVGPARPSRHLVGARVGLVIGLITILVAVGATVLRQRRSSVTSTAPASVVEIERRPTAPSLGAPVPEPPPVVSVAVSVAAAVPVPATLPAAVPVLADLQLPVTAVPRRTVQPDVSAGPTKVLDDVAYGSLPEQRLDVHRPSQVSPNGGAIVYAHGGAWVGGDEELDWLGAPLLRDLVERLGWTVFSVRYRLAADPATPGSVGTPFPAALHDLNQAVRWVKANASQFELSPDRVVLVGYSAGGHLASLLGTTWNEAAEQPPDLPQQLVGVSPRPAAVVSLAGPLDPLAWGDSNPDPTNLFTPGRIIASFAGCSGAWYTSCTPEQLSPLDVSTAADAADPAVYVAHGDIDGIVRPLPQQPVLLRMAAAMGPGKVWYDLATVGPEADRNHAVDRTVNEASLESFLAQVA